MCALLVALLGWSDATAPLDNVVYDAVSAMQPGDPGDRVLVVAVDEPFLARLGRWPFDRSLHAQVIDRVAAARPAAIGFDILLSEPGAGDAVLAASLSRAGNVVVPAQLVAAAEAEGAEPVWPVPALLASARAVGHVQVEPDSDGVLRRMASCFPVGRGALPHMAVRLHALASGPVADAGPDCAPQLLPLHGDAAFASVSYADVLAGHVPPLAMRGRIILIGATAEGLGDRFQAGGGAQGRIAGTSAIASLIDAIERDRFVAPLPLPAALTLWLLPAILVLLAARHWQPRRMIWLVPALVIATLLACASLLLIAGWWWPPGIAIAGTILVPVFWGWRRLQAASDHFRAELQRVTAGSLPPSALAADLPWLDPVGEQAARLSAALDELERRRDERERTLQLLSHDMRAPLAAILALLKEQGPERDPRIAAQTRRALRLAENFVTSARLEATPFVAEPVLLADLLLDAIDGLMPLARSHAITFELDDRSREAFVPGEPEHLSRAFSNIMANAVRFGRPGTAVSIIVERDGGMLVASVADRGSGIAPALLPRLFEAFAGTGAESGKGEDRMPGGTGLGLTLAAAVIERHRGTISAANREGGGAVFTVRLPILPDLPDDSPDEV